MKSAFKSFQIFLLLCGVFGADEDEVKSVSVMEGDSVTLNPDLTQINKFNLIDWRFGDPVIAKIFGKDISYPSHTERFRGRLQLDQTGSLSIKNMRTEHSGLYKAEISHSDGTSLRKFNVTIYESLSVIAGAEAELKSVSVKEGDPVILQTDVPQLTGDELIVWRFGDEGKLIAKHDIEAKSSPLYDERFRDRLKLDQTGSLTITNTRTTDSGEYKVKISSNKQTLYKRYTVIVRERGFSGGVVAGIVIGVLLLAVAVAGVIYYFLRPITNKLPNQTWSVPLLDNVPLNPETEIQRGDEIQWLFGETLIAEIKGENREMETYDGPDERFKNKLKQDETTGSLTIKNILTKHFGLYTLKIRRGRETFYKRFHVSVSERMRLEMERDDVPLRPDTVIQKDDEVQWLFDDKDQQTVLTEIKNTKGTKYTGPDWRFRDRLKLDEDTGLLTITNITTAHEGRYTLKITRGRDKIYTRFYIAVTERKITETEGESVTLKPAREINTDDLIRWLFGDKVQQTLIAEFNVKTGKVLPYADVADGIFRDRLELNKTTGSLTIKNTTTEHTGRYKLEIRSSSEDSEQTFIVTVREKVEKILLKEDSVTLKPHTEIQSNDQILWMFGDQDKLIAQIRGGTVEIYDDYVNKRFRGRLKLDKTGSLTITKIEDKHTGLYKLQIIRNTGEILCKKFMVSIQSRYVPVAAGEHVHLNTGLTEIQTDDKIQWRFGNSLIAEIKGGTVETHDVPDERFRDRLELNKKTGDLIIKNSTDEHTGLYRLKISSSKGNTYRTCCVFIKARNVTVTAGESVHLKTALTEIQRDDKIEWRFGDENSLIAEIKGGTGKTYDGPDERFRDRLEPDKKTGDLIIKNSRAEHAGDYKLKICRSKGNTNMTYNVTIRNAAVTKETRTESSMKEKTDPREERVNESATVEIPLLNRDDLNVVNEEVRTSSL